MRFADGRLIYIRRALLAVLIVFTAVFQHIDGAVPKLFGVPAMLLIPLVVSVAMFERSMTGLMFGAFAGLLWDFAVVRGDGYFSVVLATVGFFTGTAVTYFVRNNIYSATLLASISVYICNVGYWLLFIMRKGYEGAFGVLWSYYLPSAIYTVAFIFLYYYLVKYIVKITTSRKNRSNY